LGHVLGFRANRRLTTIQRHSKLLATIINMHSV
jgi:hypothetical protein